MKQTSRFHDSWRMVVAAGLVMCLGGFFALMSEAKKESPLTYPQAVLLIRHAEEPPNAEMSKHLSDAGRQRAEALSKLFVKSEERTVPFPKPDFLIAAKPGGKSQRSLETLEPLAKQWDLVVSKNFEKEDVEKLAQSIFHDPKYAGKTILIAWNHSTLPALARAFKVGNVPMEWKSSRFDRVWSIQYGPHHGAELQDLPQSLMPGDKSK